MFTSDVNLPFVSIGDYLVSPKTLKTLELKWNEQKNAVDMTLETVDTSFAASKLTWAGVLTDSASDDKPSWVHLKALQKSWNPNDLKTLDLRGGIYDVNQDVRWVYDSETSVQNLSYADPSQSVPIDLKNENPLLVTLGLPTMRAALSPSFPPQPRRTVLLPPFSLREHPTKDDNCDWIQPGMPGFEEQFSWEPRSTISVEDDSPSVRTVFNKISDESFQPAVSLVNAGLAFVAKLGSLAGSAQESGSWIPKNLKYKEVPYRPLLVNKIYATDAEDIVCPAKSDVPRQCLADGVNNTRTASILNALSQGSVPVALSPIGGSIDFDWAESTPVSGLKELGLHSYLGRYQTNYEVQSYLMVPWALRMEVTTKLFRNDKGKMQYCVKWRFIQPQQTYGANDEVRVFNLRPLNPTTWKESDPFLFKADIELHESNGTVVKSDVNLQGWWCGKKNSTSATVLFDDLPHPERPRTVFGDTVIQLKNINWQAQCGGQPELPCSTDPKTTKPDPVSVTVIANGTVYRSEGMELDDETAMVSFSGDVNPDTGSWTRVQLAADGQPFSASFNATAATLGSGLVRVQSQGAEQSGRVKNSARRIRQR